MARYFGAPRHKVRHTLKECACGNGTFDFSGICSVCHVEAKVLGIHTLIKLKQFSRFRKTTKNTCNMRSILNIPENIHEIRK